MKTLEQIEEIVSKLVVGKGGVGKRLQINSDPYWYVGFYVNTGGDASQPFKITLGNRNVERSIGLRSSDVFTKSKSSWLTENVYRLEPATVREVALKIHSAMTRTK